MGKKNSFVFYRSFYEALVGLDDKVKLEIFNSICELALNNKEIETTGIATNIFTLIKPQINANNERYEKGVKYGHLGGRPKVYDENKIIELINQGLKNEEIKEQIGCSITLIKNIRKTEKDKKSKTVKNSNVNENVNENVCVVFDHPQGTHTLDQFLSFSEENFKNYSKNDLKKSCEKFFNYYEDKNWEGVKNWKSKLKLWINDDIENGKIKEARQKRYL